MSRSDRGLVVTPVEWTARRIPEATLVSLIHADCRVDFQVDDDFVTKMDLLDELVIDRFMVLVQFAAMWHPIVIGTASSAMLTELMNAICERIPTRHVPYR